MPLSAWGKARAPSCFWKTIWHRVLMSHGETENLHRLIPREEMDLESEKKQKSGTRGRHWRILANVKEELIPVSLKCFPKAEEAGLCHARFATKANKRDTCT